MVAALLGVPRADLPLLRRWTEGVVAREDPLEAMRRILEFQHYFAVRIDEARHTPRGDLLSDLGRAHAGRRALDLAECLSIVRELLVAGVDRVAAAIAERAVLARATRTCSRRCAATRFSCRASSRGAPRIARAVRGAARDAHLRPVARDRGGHAWCWRSAPPSRDPSVFADPDRLDPRRANAADHLAFGHGVHACLGAALARAELAAAFCVLLERLADLRPAPGPGLAIAFRRA